MVLVAKSDTSDTSGQQIKKGVQWTDNNRTIHTEDDIIRGYVYGGKVIPVSGKLYSNFYNVCVFLCII